MYALFSHGISWTNFARVIIVDNETNQPPRWDNDMKMNTIGDLPKKTSSSLFRGELVFGGICLPHNELTCLHREAFYKKELFFPGIHEPFQKLGKPYF